MKKIKQLLTSFKNKHSIRLTWGLISGGTFFLMYLLFTLLLIFNFNKKTLHNEQMELNELEKQVVSGLSHKSSDLKADVVADYFSPTVPEKASEQSPEFESAIDYGSSNQRNRAPLYRQGFIVTVFNSEMDEVFTTKANYYPVDKYRTDEIRSFYNKQHLEAIHQLQPIYSIYDKDQLIGYVQVVNTLNRYNKIMSQIWYLFIILSVIVFIASFAAGFFLSNIFIRPITRLTAAMDDIQKNPESEIRLYEGRGHDEIDKLALTYNAMVDLMQRNISSQQQFVEDVSHELRTPISVIEGYLNMLDRWGKEDPEILEESITVSLQEIHRIKGMVQEMLSLSRAEQMPGHFSTEETSLIEVLEQTSANFKMLYPDFYFMVDIDAKQPIIGRISQGHFEQILIILLENAVKYSKERLEIHISLSTESYYATLVIQDFGIGISEEDRINVFNRFYRVDKARSRASGGTGLGLPIAKQLVEGYGGTIDVDSVVDYGTVFRIRIPLAK